MGYWTYRMVRGAVKGVSNARKADRANRRRRRPQRPWTVAQWATFVLSFVVIVWLLGMLITWSNARYGP